MGRWHGIRWSAAVLAVVVAGGLLVGPAPAAQAVTAPATNIDRSYGVQGVGSYGWTTGTDEVQPHGMAFTANGSLIALVGSHGFQELDPTGHLVPSFSTLANVPGLLASVLAIDAQGRILTGESAQWQDGPMTVRRFLPTGAPDTTFGAGGATTWADAHMSGSQLGGIAADTQGRLLVLYVRAGALPSDEVCAVTRFTAAGVLDSTYGTGGFTVLDVPKPQSTGPGCDNLLMRSDDGAYTSQILGSARLDSSGHQVAFGPAGATHLAGGFGPSAVVLPNGSIANAAGHQSTTDGSTIDGFGVHVTTAAGVPDTSFSGDGTDAISVQSLDHETSSGYFVTPAWIGRKANGDLVVGGNTITGAGVFVRWHADGTLDTTNGEGGIVYVRRTELPDNQVFGSLGALGPDGVPYQTVWANQSWAFTRGVARVSGTANTNVLTASVDVTSGAVGTVVHLTGQGCHSFQVQAASGNEGGIAYGGFGTPTAWPTIDGTFDLAIAIGADPGTRADHTYPITVHCLDTGVTVTAGQFHYTAAGSLWQTVRLRPLSPGDTTEVRALNDRGQAVGRSGSHAVWWDGAGNPHDMGTYEGCTGNTVAVNEAVSAVGTISCPSPGHDWNQAFAVDPFLGHGGFPLPDNFSPHAVATSNSISLPTQVAGVTTTGGQAHAAVSGSDGVTTPLPDLGLPSTANAISDTGYVVGTIDGLDALAAGMPPHLAVGWIGGKVFPLVASPVTTQGIDVNENAIALVQVTTPGNDHGILVNPGGSITTLNSDGMSDHVVDLNDWNLAVGRRQLTASTYAGIFYAFGQGVRLDTLVSSADRAVWTYDNPVATNNLLWVAGNTPGGQSWLMRTPGT